MIYRTLFEHVLTRTDPEQAHHAAFRAIRAARPVTRLRRTPGNPVSALGLTFPNVLGLAAGFDKFAVGIDGLGALGFGHVEIGTVTGEAQPGNPKPRLFRLPDDRAVINRMGFNNGGAPAAAARLAARAARGGVVGVNIGANKDSADRIADYVQMTQVMMPLASYLAVNVSSPNTPGLRALQDESALAALLDAVLEARGASGPPVFLKVAPDLAPADIDAIARIALDKRLGALIVSNTTVSRPSLRSPLASESGGLSGAPLAPLALERLRDFRRATGGAVPLVGVGGIASAEDAWQRIRAGASLVQLYSAMIYEGPGIARRIVRGLEALMRRDGFASVADAVGSE